MLRVVQFAGQLRARAGSSAPSLHRLFAGKANDHSDLDDDVYELLPPGASMKDPLYGLRCVPEGMSAPTGRPTRVESTFLWTLTQTICSTPICSPDQKVHSPVGKKVVSDKHAAPTVPLSREAARAKLEEQVGACRSLWVGWVWLRIVQHVWKGGKGALLRADGRGVL